MVMIQMKARGHSPGMIRDGTTDGLSITAMSEKLRRKTTKATTVVSFQLNGRRPSYVMKTEMIASQTQATGLISASPL